MKANKMPAFLCAAMMTITMSSAWAETKSAPVVGSSTVSVDVAVVAPSGYRATELLGSDVYNDKREKTGKLVELIVDADASISVAVIAVGGFLGMRARMVAIPASRFKINKQGVLVLSNASKEQLEALPEFKYAQ
jgi:hypothetical protein